MEKQEINYWKVAALILMAVSLMLFIGSIVGMDKKVNMNGLVIKESDLEAFAKVSQGRPIKICELDTKQCWGGSLVPLE